MAFLHKGRTQHQAHLLLCRTLRTTTPHRRHRRRQHSRQRLPVPRHHSSTGASAPRRSGFGDPARWRPSAPGPTAAGPSRLVGPARRRPGALGRRGAGVPAPRRPSAGAVWVLLQERWGRLVGGKTITARQTKWLCAGRNDWSNYAVITEQLRSNYADYAQITQKLRSNYAYITQKLRRNYAEITQKLRKKITQKITRVCVICILRTPHFPDVEDVVFRVGEINSFNYSHLSSLHKPSQSFPARIPLWLTNGCV